MIIMTVHRTHLRRKAQSLKSRELRCSLALPPRDLHISDINCSKRQKIRSPSLSGVTKGGLPIVAHAHAGFPVHRTTAEAGSLLS